MAQANIRIDDELKCKGEQLFNDMGMTLSTAVNIFISQAVKERAIPFRITAEPDPFFSNTNQARLRQAIADVKAGKATLTEHELIEADSDD